MRADEELLEIAAKLEAAASWIDRAETTASAEALKDAADLVAKAFSGSWLGYHSTVYYRDFSLPPPGAHFSQQYGLKDTLISDTRGQWCEYRYDDVKDHIFHLAEGADLTPLVEQEKKVAVLFDRAKGDAVSIIQNELKSGPDTFLERLSGEVESSERLSTSDIANIWHKKGQLITSDMVAIGQGPKVPPHISVLAQIASLYHTVGVCKTLSEICRKAGSHLARSKAHKSAASRIGTNVFIGHGRSHAWRELKDFIRDRLKLPFDEFNRVPVAGVTNIARLSEMLDAAAVAFVIMTAEDETAEGEYQARMNVIHEVGLFQGRLGFTKGIIMLEETCKEFTNIQGLGQIRFPKGNISAAFEDVRQVLEREGILAS